MLDCFCKVPQATYDSFHQEEVGMLVLGRAAPGWQGVTGLGRATPYCAGWHRIRLG